MIMGPKYFLDSQQVHNDGDDDSYISLKKKRIYGQATKHHPLGPIPNLGK